MHNLPCDGKTEPQPDKGTSAKTSTKAVVITLFNNEPASRL